MSIDKKTDVGYISEVDLKYPNELHELHNDYPLALEKLTVTNDILSNYCKLLHYKNLQLYLSLGMKLTKIHTVLKFKQSDWMKKYIDFNTKKRMCATNDFEKDFFKLMINSVYGKTMENLRKRINARLVNNKKDFLKCASNQLMLLINYLIKILLLFMKLNQY